MYTFTCVGSFTCLARETQVQGRLCLLVEWLTRSTYNPKRVSERVRSRPGHIQKLE
jgi:hypothetical protein